MTSVTSEKEESPAMGEQATNTKKQGRLYKAALFCSLAIFWIALDFLVKRLVDGGAYAVGQQFAGPFLGLFEFVLVHNTGAAWGIFSGSTIALGIFSVVMCVAIFVYFMWQRDDISLLETIGLALVFAGGIGNAIDRFAQQYVVDFINFTFMSFPVFNIADIGVTCGIAIFLIGFLTCGLGRHEAEPAEEAAAPAAPADGEEPEPAEEPAPAAPADGEEPEPAEEPASDQTPGE